MSIGRAVTVALSQEKALSFMCGSVTVIMTGIGNVSQSHQGRMVK